MSRHIVLYIAVSLDGFIASPGGAVDWLVGQSEDTAVDTGYEQFLATVDTVVMGRTTYEQLIYELSPDVWVYEGLTCYVASSTPRLSDGRAEFISSDITGFIQNLKNQPGKDIWLVGGGKLLDPFFKENLIDLYVITIIPTILGTGIPLFLPDNPTIKLRLLASREIDGMVELTYERRLL
jgi:dihydrofolate reductase